MLLQLAAEIFDLALQSLILLRQSLFVLGQSLHDIGLLRLLLCVSLSRVHSQRSRHYPGNLLWLCRFELLDCILEGLILRLQIKEVFSHFVHVSILFSQVLFHP